MTMLEKYMRLYDRANATLAYIASTDKIHEFSADEAVECARRALADCERIKAVVTSESEETK